MLSLVSYYRLMIAYFAYSASISGVLTIIFALLACIISSRRYYLFLATLGLFIDTLVASIAGYVSSSALKETELFPSRATETAVAYEILGGWVLFSYVIIRILIWVSGEVRQELWDSRSILVRLCDIIQLWFSIATGCLLFIHFVVFAAWILLKIVVFLGVTITWPLQYFFHRENPITFSTKFVANNTTVIPNTMINTTKIM